MSGPLIGHGGYHLTLEEGLVAFANEQGQTHLLRATELGRLLSNHPSLRLVVLNACEGAKGGERDLFSSTAATLARKGIPAVLAMQYEITDRAAIECTRAFYEALAGGLAVDEALAEARTAISLGVVNTLEWGIPVLYLRAADSRLFFPPSQTTTRPGPSGAIPAPQPSGSGRRGGSGAPKAAGTGLGDHAPLKPPSADPPPARVSAPPDPGSASGHHTGQRAQSDHWLPGPSPMGVAPGAPTPGALPEPRGGQRQRMALLLSALLAVLLVVGAGVGVYVVVHSPPVTRITPTPGPTQPPASTVISPTATSTPNATATAVATLLGRYNTITSGTPSFLDPLNNPNTTTWAQGISAQGTCKIENGGFHFTTPDSLWNCFDHSGRKFANFVYRVQLVISRGGGGMSFRATSQAYYRFHITQDGGYYASYNVAKKLVEFELKEDIPRSRLRAGYGEGFKGAPLCCHSSGEGAFPRDGMEPHGDQARQNSHLVGGAQHV